VLDNAVRSHNAVAYPYRIGRGAATGEARPTRSHALDRGFGEWPRRDGTHNLDKQVDKVPDGEADGKVLEARGWVVRWRRGCPFRSRVEEDAEEEEEKWQHGERGQHEEEAEEGVGGVISAWAEAARELVKGGGGGGGAPLLPLLVPCCVCVCVCV